LVLAAEDKDPDDHHTRQRNVSKICLLHIHASHFPPEESQHYLRSLNNVRSDKFSLHWMVYKKKVQVASMLSVYRSRDRE
jgi:hypothetical protein